MPTYKLIVLTQPVEGREDEYNDWYQNVHLHDVAALDGVKRAQRYRLNDNVAGEEPFPYLAIYEIEADSPDAVIAEMRARPGTDLMKMSDALSPRVYAAVYEEFGEPVES